MYQTLEAMKEQGYSVEKLTPTSTGSEIVWDSEKNQFVLIMKDKNGNAEYYTGTAYTEYNTNEYYKLWKIFTSVEDVNGNTTYSAYLAGKEQGGAVSVNGVGFDAGENAGISSVLYSNSSNSARNIVIRTNSASTTLTINGYVDGSNNGDSVNHYGSCGKVVASVAMHCYYENGKTATLELTKGKVVVNNGASVKVVYVNPTAGANIEVSSFGGTVEKAYAMANVENAGNVAVEVKTADEISDSMNNAEKEAKTEEEMNQFSDKTLWIECKAESFAGGEGTTENPYQIATARQLALLAYNVNNNVEDGKYATASYILTADIDLSGKGWTPIGNLANPFRGNFSGKYDTNKSHIISRMNDKDFDAKMSDIASTTYTQSTGNIYGLFGVVGTLSDQPAVENQTFEFVTLKDVSINSKTAIILAGLVGADTASANKDSKTLNSNLTTNFNFKNIEVFGEIKVDNKDSVTVSGVVCKLYTQGSVNIVNCKNSANIYAINNTKPHKAGGVAGYLKNNKTITFNNNVNSGNLYLYGYIYGGLFVSELSDNTESVEVKNNTNSGNIYCSYIADGEQYKTEENLSKNCGNGATIAYIQDSGKTIVTENNNFTGTLYWDIDSANIHKIYTGNDYNFRSNWNSYVIGGEWNKSGN